MDMVGSSSIHGDRLFFDMQIHCMNSPSSVTNTNATKGIYTKMYVCVYIKRYIFVYTNVYLPIYTPSLSGPINFFSLS